MIDEIFTSEVWASTKKEKIAQLGDIEIWRVEGELDERDIEPLYGEWVVIAVRGEPRYTFSVLHGSKGTEIEPVPLVEKHRLLQLLERLKKETRARISNGICFGIRTTAFPLFGERSILNPCFER